MNFKYYKSGKLVLLIIGLTIFFGALTTLIDYLLLKVGDPFKTIVLFTDTFTVPFFITIVMYKINNSWWKSEKLNWLIDLPNLNGRYEGKLYSSYIDEVTGDKIIMDCVLEIKQTASSIHISGYFGNISKKYFSSSSGSVAEEIIKKRNDLFELYYVFANETGALADKLNNHTGTVKFLYYPDLRCLDGDYYNKLNNTGVIKVFFKQKLLLGRFLENIE